MKSNLSYDMFVHPGSFFHCAILLLWGTNIACGSSVGICIYCIQPSFGVKAFRATVRITSIYASIHRGNIQTTSYNDCVLL